MCYEPIPFYQAEIDHVIPEQLRNDPPKFNETLRLFGLSSGFQLNNYENWLPCCRRCNGLKGNRVFKPTPLIQHWLEKADDKKCACQAAETEIRSNISIGKAFGAIRQAAEQGPLSNEVVLGLANIVRAHDPAALQGQPIMFNSSNSVQLTESSTTIHYQGQSTFFEYQVPSTNPTVPVSATKSSNE
jgi:hypothetical protein